MFSIVALLYLYFLFLPFEWGVASQVYFSIFWLSGLPAPDPGNYLYAQKVTKKAPGDPDPSFCLIGRNQGLLLVATEIPCGRWPLVIGTVVVRLRLTAPQR